MQFLQTTRRSPANITLAYVREIAAKYGWNPDNGVPLREWLDKQLSEGNQAKQLVSRWEEDSLKGQ